MEATDSPAIRMVFETEADFRREFEANLCNGGVFVPTDRTFELRDHVGIAIEFPYCGQTLLLEGEVVHHVPAALASVGARPGVAIQLLLPASELRARLEALEGAFSAGDPEEASAADRRRAPRGKARVTAYLVSADGEEQQGFTRNLSETGVLFSVTTEPVLPLDTEVRLRLCNPVSGEAREVAGYVARHVTDEHDEVTAIGIHFESEQERPDGVTAFLHSLMATEHSRHLGGISGSISELGTMSLLQNFSQSTPQGTLTVASGALEGFVAFEAGCMVAARLGSVSGMKALARILSWDEGRFEFHARVDESPATNERMSMQGAMMEAARQIDELARLDLRALPLSARVEVACPEPEGGLEKAVAELCATRPTLRRVLDLVPLPDLEVFQALLRLLEAGAIRLQPSRR